MLLALSAAILATIGMVWVYQHQKSEMFQMPSLTDLLKKIDIHIPEDALSSQKSTENPLALSYYSSHKNGRLRGYIPPDVQIPSNLATAFGGRLLTPGASVPPTLEKPSDTRKHDVYIPMFVYPNVPLSATAQIPNDRSIYKGPRVQVTPTSTTPPSYVVGEPRPLPEASLIPPVEAPPSVSVPPGMFIPPDSDIQIPQDANKATTKEKHKKRKVGPRYPENSALVTPEILNTTIANSEKVNLNSTTTDKANPMLATTSDGSNITLGKSEEMNYVN